MPLYSTRDGEVHRGNGLNHWNAGGRARQDDDLYIPIPKLIHEKFDGFFPYSLEEYQYARKNKKRYSGPAFTLELPNGKHLSASVCQENGKALMSNPYRALGNWMLRHVLKVPPNTLVTYSMLAVLGINSVIVTKISADHFRIDFSGLGSYDEFEEEYKK